MRKAEYIVSICLAFVLVLASFMIVVPHRAENTVYTDGCKLLLSNGCNQESINGIIVLRNRTGNYTLGNICAREGYGNSILCAKSCGCSAGGTASILSGEPLKSYSDNPVGEGALIVGK